MGNDIFNKEQEQINTQTNNGNAFKNFANNLNEFKQNPFAFMLKHKYNIPDNLQYNPEGIIQHMMSTGQMNQQQLDYVRNVKGMIENNFKRNKAF
jgi:hypothetical protein